MTPFSIFSFPQLRALGRAQDLAELYDHGLDLFVLLDDLVALEMGQPLELHLQDGLGLDLRQLENGGSRSSFGLASGLFCIQLVKCHKQDDRSQGEMKQPDCRCVNRCLKKEKNPGSIII
jgi:hypothetical protein